MFQTFVFLILILFTGNSVLSAKRNRELSAIKAIAQGHYSNSATLLTISEQELVNFLFKNYSSDCRPRRDASQPIEINLGLSFYAINEIIERTHQIIATASLTVQWWDEFLTWKNKSPYNSVKLFAYPNNKIWLPDIALTNSGDLYALMHSRGMMAVIHSTGAVEYFPEATVTTFCQFDLTYFPYDTQVCDYKFESWSYILQQQTFTLASPPVNLHRYGANEQWDLVDTVAKTYNACYIYTTSLSYCYPGANFKLLLKRKSDYYTIMIMIPSLIFSLVEMVAFSLPLAEVSKMQITFTCLLSYAVFQTTVKSDMPRTSDHNPLLSIYFDLQMGYIAFALLGEACVFIILQQAVNNKKAPEWALGILCISKPCCIDDEDEVALPAPPLLLKHYQPQQEMTTATVTIDAPPNNSAISNIKDQQQPPSRGVISKRLVEATTNENNNNNNKKQPATSSSTAQGADRQKWVLLAKRVESIIASTYFVAITLTPIVMFYFAPMVFENPHHTSDYNEFKKH